MWEVPALKISLLRKELKLVSHALAQFDFAVLMKQKKLQLSESTVH